MDIDFFKRLASSLAQQFGENCEVLVHDLRGGDPEHTIVAIENGHVSHRQAGDGPSRIVLQAMNEKDPSQLEDRSAYLLKTHDGRIVKSSTIYIRNSEGKIDGILSINYDITELLMAQRAIGSLLNHSEEQRVPARIPQNVNDLLDDLIAQSVQIAGKPVALMTKSDKIKAIHFLNDAGAFLVTRSGDKVSKYFGISKYTLYSYIDANIED
ncbi:MAG TPA: helix-turn-helix transcriptional regulator [Eubacteriales bacterium]|nr:helix-turn-helix transcriptional regulator [Clostridia bacterium]HRV73490.1 helix-turn-helix transcriptional regulator [Eubacteriales bacterium]